MVDIHMVGRIFPGNNTLIDQWLSPEEKVYLSKLRLRKRYNEWLSGRIAAKWGLFRQSSEAFRPAGYTILPDIHGCPQLSPTLPGLHFSISHSRQFCAALTADAPCGVDIQKISRQILRVKKRVATETEIQMAKRAIGNDEEAAITLIWTIKEAVKKHCLSSQPGIFEAITIQSVKATEETHWSAECFVKTINHKQDVNIVRLDRYMLAWSTGKTKKERQNMQHPALTGCLQGSFV